MKIKHISKLVVLPLLFGMAFISTGQDKIVVESLASQYVKNASINSDNKIKNVIMFIGDGMGPNHVRAGEIFKGSPLVFSDNTNAKWSYHGYQNTDSLTSEGFMLDTTKSLLRPDLNSSLYDDSPNPYAGSGNLTSLTCYTDSAAGGTALATGFKTTNSNIGIGPTGHHYQNLVEIASMLGKKTGVVSTDKITGATPASFLTHVDFRHLQDEIVDGIAISNANLVMGKKPDVWSSEKETLFMNNGWHLANSLTTLDKSSNQEVCVFDNLLANSTLTPDLADLTAYSLDKLDNEEGFFLMVEGSNIDTASHSNQAGTMLEELMEFDQAVQVAQDWADARGDTLIVVTADHETGALYFDEDTTSKSTIKDDIRFLSVNHSRTRVRVDVYGDISSFLTKYDEELHEQGTLNEGMEDASDNYWQNTDVFKLCVSYL